MDKFGRIRRRMIFELNTMKAGERELFDRLRLLKKSRQYVTTIRNALRLWFALLDGDTSLLRELFPGVVRDLEYSPLVQEFRNHMLRSQPMPIEAETNALPTLFVESGVGRSEVSASEARVNFASGMGDLFGDDEDEWT